MRIVESGGVYTGKVEKIIDPDAPKDAVCKDCTDDRKDKPVVGMTIIRNMKPSAGDKNVLRGRRRSSIRTTARSTAPS